MVDVATCIPIDEARAETPRRNPQLSEEIDVAGPMEAAERKLGVFIAVTESRTFIRDAFGAALNPRFRYRCLPLRRLSNEQQHLLTSLQLIIFSWGESNKEASNRPGKSYLSFAQNTGHRLA